MNLENSIDEKFSQTSILSMHEPEKYKVHDNFRKYLQNVSVLVRKRYERMKVR